MTETKESQKSKAVWGKFVWGDGTQFDDRGIDTITDKKQASRKVKI